MQQVSHKLSLVARMTPGDDRLMMEAETEMQFGLMIPNLGPYGDAQTLVDLARDAEAAGWDGFFVWDTFRHAEAAGRPVADAWIALAAIAASTQRIRIGPRVSAPPRHRPWLLAQQAVSLDRLSGGRLILSVGSGDLDDQGFSVFGEELDARKRAGMLDESLEIMAGLWSGEPFAFAGQYYRFEAFQMLPRPVQQPRIPIWVAGTWPKSRPMERGSLGRRQSVHDLQRRRLFPSSSLTTSPDSDDWATSSAAMDRVGRSPSMLRSSPLRPTTPPERISGASPMPARPGPSRPSPTIRTSTSSRQRAVVVPRD